MNAFRFSVLKFEVYAGSLYAMLTKPTRTSGPWKNI